ncbi:disulfide bond formation protein B [Pseudomonas cichorii]|nr:disulfide bond formation protein B [Pseudomonas cichorii]MBX8512222.1 disulfide bond formation protein B [Pseudomonas cichorii]MBX8521131.1 disulfide bond formation protein B [Pseudomonas cichorii]MBX8527203.1 disulfide bond formation protein B [Pseudomonas cichorii]MBX8553819.1 disulfide bond formation protein B [Pseudomonas cichorii]
MYLARTRTLFFLAFIASALIIGATLYLQHAFGLIPCILCLIQRAFVIGCGLVCLVAAIHSPQEAGWRRYCVVLLALALPGALVAGFHIWLQTASVEELMPVVTQYQHLLNAFSLENVSEPSHSGTYLCAEINWSLFDITLPEWSLLAFVILCLLALYPLFSGLHRWMSVDTDAGY